MIISVNNKEIFTFNSYGMPKQDVIGVVNSHLLSENLKEGEMVVFKSETNLEHLLCGTSALYYWRGNELVEKYPSLFS